jgi:membrane protein YdbS with pleckstrin-like domain
VSKAAEKATAWVYRGLWGVLVRWLRVPQEPPGIPPGSGEVVRSVKPAPGFLKYLKFQFWILLLIIDVAIIGVWAILLVASPLAGVITAPVFWGVAIVPDIFAYAALHVRYDTTWYIVSSRGVRIRRGVWIIRESTITFENVQNVEVRQGPLQRHFGISNVLIQTAGGGASGAHGESGASSHQGLLEGVENAGELRDLITARARASRGAGLGDDRSEPIGTRGAFSAAQLDALREIRSALA